MKNNQTITQCLLLLKSAYLKMEFNQQSVAVYQLALADINPDSTIQLFNYSTIQLLNYSTTQLLNYLTT